MHYLAEAFTTRTVSNRIIEGILGDLGPMAEGNG